MQVKVPLELILHLEATYRPGKPATPPSYASGGDPPEAPEIEVQKLDDITVEFTKHGKLHGVEGFHKFELSILSHLSLEVDKKALCSALLAALLATDSTNEIIETAIEEEAL